MYCTPLHHKSVHHVLKAFQHCDALFVPVVWRHVSNCLWSPSFSLCRRPARQAQARVDPCRIVSVVLAHFEHGVDQRCIVCCCALLAELASQAREPVPVGLLRHFCLTRNRCHFCPMIDGTGTAKTHQNGLSGV